MNIIGLAPETTYSVTVNAMDEAGNISSLSSALDVKTLKSVDSQGPSIPANLSAENVTIKSLTLNWTASTDNEEVRGYEIYMNDIFIGTSSGVTFSVTGLTAASYSFKILAFDTTGNKSAFTDKIVVNMLTTSIKDISSNELSISPNPANSFVIISDLLSGETITIYSVDGKVIKSFIASSESITLNLNGLQKGSYLIGIAGKRPVMYRKLIIE